MNGWPEIGRLCHGARVYTGFTGRPSRRWSSRGLPSPAGRQASPGPAMLVKRRMDPRLNIVTLGVRDLARAVRFYRDGLGWNPAVEVGDFVLFEMGGAALALHPLDALAEDAGVLPGPPAFGGVTLAQNVA